MRFVVSLPLRLRELFPKGNNFQRDEIKGSESYITQLFYVYLKIPYCFQVSRITGDEIERRFISFTGRACNSIANFTGANLSSVFVGKI